VENALRDLETFYVDDIYDNNTFIDEFLPWILCSSPKITDFSLDYLDSSSMNVHHLVSIVMSLPKLKSFRLFSAGNSSFEEITEGCLIQISQLKSLEVLDLNEFPRLISDSIVQTIFRECPNLVTVSLMYMDNLREITFPSHHVSKISDFDLTFSVILTDTTLLNISMHCPHLQKLVLAAVDMITDEGVRHLAGGGCSKLQELNLAYCSNITDKSIEYLAEGCKMLERLDLRGCNQVTVLPWAKVRVKLVASDTTGRGEVHTFICISQE